MRKKAFHSEISLSRRILFQRLLGMGGMIATGTFLEACSNNSPTYYTLSPMPGKILSGGPAIIEVRTPSIASSLDRDRIVSETGSYQLGLTSGAAWSEALNSMIGRITALNLSQRLPNSRIFAQNQATFTQPDAYVELDISRFNKDSKGNAVVTASIAVHKANANVALVGHNQLLNLENAPKGSSTSDLVETLSALLGRIADITAQYLIALPRRS
ncbi:MAG: PqiC family protein [Commensalibacter sp.]|nr:PqiC family protein [Commensalibacter sp.]